MINDILDYTQISNGKLRLNYEKFSLLDTINEIINLFIFQAEQKGLEVYLQNKLNSGLESNIRTDKVRLKQVILNLLGNALKFTDKGSITIVIEENNEMKNVLMGKHQIYRVLTISVIDTGIGIKPEDQPKLFRIFGKLEIDNHYNKNQTGVGLGLAISQSLVKILNKNVEASEIKVHSEFGKGSCFYFNIISYEDEENEGNVTSNEDEIIEGELEEKIFNISDSITFFRTLEQQNNMVSSMAKKKILPTVNVLIVDDDHVNVFVASSFLKSSERFRFDVSYNGLDAVKKVKQRAEEMNPFDIILMDCNMPVMDGFEATTILRQMLDNRLIPSLRIIACTANKTDSDRERCFEVGMHDYISKPFTRELLFDKIESNLDRLTALYNSSPKSSLWQSNLH